jgi:tryptophan synthase alpha subunit
MAKIKEKSDNLAKDEKKKKLNSWSYYLAWIAFGSAVGSAFVKLIEKWEPPKKDEHYTK